MGWWVRTGHGDQRDGDFFIVSNWTLGTSNPSQRIRWLITIRLGNRQWSSGAGTLRAPSFAACPT